VVVKDRVGPCVVPDGVVEVMRVRRDHTIEEDDVGMYERLVKLIRMNT
jgi:hypothetical protein